MSFTTFFKENTALVEKWFSKYGNDDLKDQFEQGLTDEDTVKAILESNGYQVRFSDTTDNKTKDIDLWVTLGATEIPVSVKGQHTGLAYGHIGLELEQQLRNGQWLPNGWWATSEAKWVAILQGEELRVYTKDDLTAYIESHGFIHIKPLSRERKSYLLNSKYPFIDAKCGYLDRDKVPHKSYLLRVPLGV
jgi:hypothetical protein